MQVSIPSTTPVPHLANLETGRVVCGPAAGRLGVQLRRELGCDVGADDRARSRLSLRPDSRRPPRSSAVALTDRAGARSSPRFSCRLDELGENDLGRGRRLLCLAKERRGHRARHDCFPFSTLGRADERNGDLPTVRRDSCTSLNRIVAGPPPRLVGGVLLLGEQEGSAKHGQDTGIHGIPVIGAS